MIGYSDFPDKSESQRTIYSKIRRFLQGQVSEWNGSLIILYAPNVDEIRSSEDASAHPIYVFAHPSMHPAQLWGLISEALAQLENRLDPEEEEPEA